MSFKNSKRSIQVGRSCLRLKLPDMRQALGAGNQNLPRPKPPMTPYVTIRTGTFGEKVERTNPTQDKIDPAMQDTRMPNLLTIPPTIGPDTMYTPAWKWTVPVTNLGAWTAEQCHKSESGSTQLKKILRYTVANAGKFRHLSRAS